MFILKCITPHSKKIKGLVSLNIMAQKAYNKNLESIFENDPYELIAKKIGSDYKKYREKWKMSAKKNFIPKFPLHLDIDLQDSCNLKCVICHQKYSKRTNNITNFQLLKKIIDECSKKGLKAINFGASGEPLIKKELLTKVISYASKKGILDIFMHTNGFLLDKEISKEIIGAGLTQLCISIDASNKNTFKKVRNSSAYEKIVNNLLNFIELRNGKGLKLPIVRVSFVVTQLNYKEKEKFIKLWGVKPT